jgi:nucleoid-associated protein YgaU
MSALLTMDPVQAMLAQTSLQNTLFASNSRYYGIATATLQKPGQPPIAYLLRRFLPPSSSFQVVETHTVVAGDRLDNIAAKFLGDPTLFWRLCDANNAMRPDELVETPGSQLNITLPQGVTGTAL